MTRRARGGTVHQLKISLRRSMAPIWRRVLLPDDATLRTLHAVIQHSMGWDFAHLHRFRVGDMLIGDPEFLDDVVDQAEITLAELGLREGDKFEYLYDFGDSWDHEVRLEKVLERDPDTRYPVCIKAVRAAPPEDVGGMYGYHAMLEALDDPQHPSHEQFSEWLMVDEWDPEAVDLDGINEALSRVKV